MRKQAECDLYNHLLALCTVKNTRQPGRSAIIHLSDEYGIAHNQAFRYLEKWSGKGWWDYGMWAWGGWFTDDAPEWLNP